MIRIKEKKIKLEETISTSRGSVAHYVLRPKYVYKRAHSELQLLNILDDNKLEKGYSYNFITSGDVDQVSYLSLVLRTFNNIEHLIVSSWCMASEDIVYIFNLHKDGKIKKVDFYVGEIFKNSYPKEYTLLCDMYKKYPIGRMCLFKNHSKIFAIKSCCGQGIGVQTSANMNTNPRTENGNITVDNGIYDFYKEYFDGIKSFI